MCPQRDVLTCAEVGERLEAWLDGELTPAESESVGTHIESCAECSEELRLAEEIAFGLRSLTRLEPPLSVLDGVRNTAWGPQASVARRDLALIASPRRAWVGLAAAATVVMALGTVAWQGRPRPAHPDETVSRATAEARVALAYVGLAGRRTAEGLRTDLLRDRVVKPTLHGLSLTVQQAADPEADTTQSPAIQPTSPPRTRS